MNRGVQKSTALWRVLWLWLAVALLAGAGGCSDEPADGKNGTVEEQRKTQVITRQPEFRSLQVEEASALLNGAEAVLVVDVRTPEERAMRRIPGSVAAPLDEILQGRSQLPNDKLLLLVCEVGGRSYAAGLYLVREQYKWVYNLRGGIAAWEKAGLPVDRGAN